VDAREPTRLQALSDTTPDPMGQDTCHSSGTWANRCDPAIAFSNRTGFGLSAKQVTSTNTRDLRHLDEGHTRLAPPDPSHPAPSASSPSAWELPAAGRNSSMCVGQRGTPPMSNDTAGRTQSPHE
jgi:hypothetical protein